MLNIMEVPESDAREQIQRLVRTDLFRFSELQRRLLLYLSEKSLSGEADRLKEYIIAVDALGKPESYDPRRDSTVRLQSSKLRQRISEYYRTEGQSDDVLVDFPKGHFKLVFTYRPPAALPAAPDPAGPKRYPVTLLSLAALSLLLTGLCVYLGFALARAERRNMLSAETWTPALQEFWSPFLSRHEDVTLICVGAPLFVRLSKAGFLIRDSEVNSWAEPAKAELISRLKHLFPDDTPAPWHNFTGVGEAGGAVLVGNLLSTGGLRLHFADSDQLTWNEIGEHNVVFVGPPKFISQIDELPVVRDLAVESSGIRNLRPRKGEPAFLEDAYTDPEHQDGHTHALISRLPGLHGNGEILILGGTWTEGTLAASQYLTLETHVAELLTRIRLPSGKLPPYFEAVISVTTKHSTPVQVSYVFHHVLTPLPQRRSSAE